MKKRIKTLLKIIISVGLFALILHTVDLKSVAGNFKLLDPRYIPLIVLLFFLNYFVSSIRWKFLLIYRKSEEVSVWYLTALYFMGSFFNNFMPTSIGGDVYKVYRLGKKIENTPAAFSATFMERFTGMMALVIISYFGLMKTLNFWIGMLPESMLASRFLVGAFKFLVLFGFWIAAALGFLALKFLAKKIGVFKKVYDAMVAYKDHKTVLLNAFITSFAVQVVAILSHFFVLKAIGVDVPIFYALFVFPVIFLTSFIIPSLNGMGVQDFLYIQFFTAVGVSADLALSASIIYHLFRVFVSLIGGVLYAVEKSPKQDFS